MYKFIEKWEEIGREVYVRKNTIDILEGGRPVFRFYLEGYYKHLKVFEYTHKEYLISQVILELLNETMKELESERDV